MPAQREHHFWVYIISSRSRNLYTGLTSALLRRSIEHREQNAGTHTARYRIHRLVYYQYFKYIRSAIRRENEIKGWTREQKIALIEQFNPTWEDLLPDIAAGRNRTLPPSSVDAPKKKQRD